MSDEAEQAAVISIPNKKRPNSGKPKTSAAQIKKVARLEKALKMRRDGFTYDEIIRDLGHWKSVQACQKAVAAVLERSLLDAGSELKMVNLMRLEACVAAVLKKAENGNLLAVDRIIRISKREGEILGFDEGSSNDLNIGFEIVVKDESERPKDK